MLALAAEVVASRVVFMAVDAVAAGPGVTAVPLRAQAPSFNVPAVRCRYEGKSLAPPRSHDPRSTSLAPTTTVSRAQLPTRLPAQTTAHSLAVTCGKPSEWQSVP